MSKQRRHVHINKHTDVDYVNSVLRVRRGVAVSECLLFLLLNNEVISKDKSIEAMKEEINV